MNFTISELVQSATAKKENIDNTPDLESLDNMLELICSCLQPIRDKIKNPMIITSGYRCAELNRIVGGKSNSQHLRGEAVDFIIKGITPAKIVDFILKTGIDFDQLINEKNQWVHISYTKKRKNRRDCFLSY